MPDKNPNARPMPVGRCEPTREEILRHTKVPSTVGMVALELFGQQHPALPVVVLPLLRSKATPAPRLTEGRSVHSQIRTIGDADGGALTGAVSKIYGPTFMEAGPAPAGSNQLEELTERQHKVHLLGTLLA